MFVKPFTGDLGRARTCNHQSRNLRFYPVELRSRYRNQKKERRQIFFTLVSFFLLLYTKSFLTIVEIVFPSADPPICAEANPITFPIDAIPDAPVSAMILAIIASTSVSDN